ncbi:MAG TPA: GNAT family protein [Terriglobia bacterium]|nr:GNAT family protein [Terriglobia bacterium]
MLTLRVNQSVELKECGPHHAPALFALVEANRARLRQWLPWLDETTEIAHVERFLRDSRRRAEQENAYTFVARCEGRIIGVVAENSIDWRNRRVELGYWIDHEYQGRGIVTQSVARLTRRAFEDLGLNRVAIHCAVGNTRSRAVPERLGFTFEGILREGEKLYDRYVDLAMYGMLAREWKAQRKA